MTDHGSIRLRCNRARRGPRVAAAVAAPRLCGRAVSGARTRLAPGRVGAVTDATYGVDPFVWRTPAPVTVDAGAVGGTTAARAITGVDPPTPGTGAVPVATLAVP